MEEHKMVGKILEWVDDNKSTCLGPIVNKAGELDNTVIFASDIKEFINTLLNPQKKMVWHMRTKDNMEWRPVTDAEHEAGQHLARFEFQQFEV